MDMKSSKEGNEKEPKKHTNIDLNVAAIPN